MNDIGKIFPVLCPNPSCGKYVVSFVQMKNDDSLYTEKGIPTERDENGNFMKCPHCGHRVPLRTRRKAAAPVMSNVSPTSSDMKKDKELAIVESFLRWIAPQDSAVLEPDRERPDALVRIGTQTVGLEITTITEANPRQAIAPQEWMSAAERIVQAAQQSFENHNSEALVVRFEFVPTWQPPGRAEAAKLATELAAIAVRLLEHDRLQVVFGDPIILHDAHRVVSWAYIARTSGHGTWAPMYRQDVSPALPDDIVSTVARKEGGVDHYRRAAEVVWLLIDCELSGQGISLDIPRSGVRVRTSFDRVFCCRHGLFEWTEIEVARPD